MTSTSLFFVVFSWWRPSKLKWPRNLEMWIMVLVSGTQILC